MLTQEQRQECAKWLQPRPWGHNGKYKRGTSDMYCTKCGTKHDINWVQIACPFPDPLTISDEEISFSMRDLCQAEYWKFEAEMDMIAIEQTGNPDIDSDNWFVWNAKPEHWVAAALSVLESE